MIAICTAQYNMNTIPTKTPSPAGAAAVLVPRAKLSRTALN
jgi:hypothetical protein